VLSYTNTRRELNTIEINIGLQANKGTEKYAME